MPQFQCLPGPTVPLVQMPQNKFFFEKKTFSNLFAISLSSWTKHFVPTGLILHQQVMPLALVTNLASNWCYLHWFQFWEPGGAAKTQRQTILENDFLYLSPLPPLLQRPKDKQSWEMIFCICHHCVAAADKKTGESSDPRVRHRMLVGRAKMRTIKVVVFI